MSTKKRQRLESPFTKHRKLAQMYERLFPTTADRIWAVRRNLNMTQKEIAETSGLSASVFSNMECGYTLPTGRTLVKIAQSLGVPTDFLLGVDARTDQRVRIHAEEYLVEAAAEMAPKKATRGRQRVQQPVMVPT